MNQNKLLPIVFLFTLSCATSLSNTGKEVLIEVSQEKVSKCKNLGTVVGSNAMGASTAHDAEGALNEMRNKAAQLGANTVYMSKTDSNVFATTAIGIAYLCADQNL